MKGYGKTGIRRMALAAAMVLGGGLFAANAAKAAPFAAPPAEALAAESGVTSVHWRHHHHHHHFGHRHRHHGWGWGHRRHHHHGWGHRHHHHHRHHRHFF